MLACYIGRFSFDSRDIWVGARSEGVSVIGWIGEGAVGRRL